MEGAGTSKIGVSALHSDFIMSDDERFTMRTVCRTTNPCVAEATNPSVELSSLE